VALTGYPLDVVIRGLSRGPVPNFCEALRLHPSSLQRPSLAPKKKFSYKVPMSEARGLEAGKSCVFAMQARPKEPQQVAFMHKKCIVVDP